MNTEHDIIGQTIMRATPATLSNPRPRVSLSRRHRHEDYYAFINPFKLDEVKDVKVDVGIHGMTVTEVKGFERQKGNREVCRGPESTTDFVPTVKIEVFAQDNLIPPLVETITHSAKTGIVSDGKIFVEDFKFRRAAQNQGDRGKRTVTMTPGGISAGSPPNC